MDPAAINPENSVKTCFSFCAICEGQAHGTHFGVPACRACAAFFRRSFVLGRNYKCRRTIGQCNITRETRFSCRGCRLEKCIKAGMTPDNVQCDSSNNEAGDVESQKLDQNNRRRFFETKPNMEMETAKLYFSLGATNEEKKAVAGEIDRLTQQICDIFSCPIRPQSGGENFPYLTALQKMTLASQRTRDIHVPNPKYLDYVQLPSNIQVFWQKVFLNMAQWMQQCDAFSTLPLDQKLLIFKSSWCSIMRLEKMAISITTFGEATITERKCFLAPNACVNKYTHFDVSSICTLDSEHVLSMVRPILNLLFDEVAKPLFEIQATQIEYVYIMCLTMWNVENWGVSESTLRAAESYRERISAELHDYYMHSLGQQNYASRLITLMRAVQSNERVQNARGDLIELVRLFDYLNLDFPTGKILDWRRM